MSNYSHMALYNCSNQIQSTHKHKHSQTADCNTTMISLSQFKREIYQYANNSESKGIQSILKYTDEEMNKIFHLLGNGTEKQLLDYMKNRKQYFGSRSIKQQKQCITITPRSCRQPPSKDKLNYNIEQEILELEKQQLEKQKLETEILDELLENVKQKLYNGISDNQKK
eukprot:486734_1